MNPRGPCSWLALCSQAQTQPPPSGPAPSPCCGGRTDRQAAGLSGCWVGMAGPQPGPGPALQQPLGCPALIRSPHGEHRAPPAASEALGANPSPAMAASHRPCLWEEAHSAFCVSSKLSFQTGLETTQNSRKFRSGVWKTAGGGRGEGKACCGAVTPTPGAAHLGRVWHPPAHP